MAKQRLDSLIVERGLADSRTRAQLLIRAGSVHVAGQRIIKPAHPCVPDVELLVDPGPPYVSRGGEKLEGALKEFGIDVSGMTAIDVGASTGGFTDCLLQSGASKVYSVDVGKGQLSWDLRKDDRVVVMEKMNARRLIPAQFPDRVQFAVVDVSFISLTKVIPAVRDVLEPRSCLLTLVKPQFEAGRAQVERGGVVRDPAVHQEVIEKIRRFGTEDAALECRGVVPSVLKGPAGNIEFFAYWRKMS
ncbi:MAG: TlyA family RNA methyltransferase [Verrucomicrobia bacterium]|nr:TlyA family RNA methyltransferase [Verrucomicrobiota bacterium]MDA1086836.1 TlyA family RNA methyltransferase [Verrucomicrobiota bacterium]